MVIKIGDEVEYNGKKMVVTDIAFGECVDAWGITITAKDHDAAAKQQIGKMNFEQSIEQQQQVLSAISDTLKKNGGIL